MSKEEEFKTQLEQAEMEIGYLKRLVARMKKRLERQEKIDDMNRHQTKWAMQQLEQARVLAEQASQAKTDFLANMSHEIRTPLNIVLGMGELLDGTNLEDSQKQYLQSLRFSGEHLLKLINDILEFSRIESGTISLVNKAFNLKELMVEIEDMGARLALEKGIEFSLDFDESVKLNRVGDSPKIRQVLFNLVGNAVKYTDSGRVCLGVEGGRDDDEEKILITVSDTGIGIPEEKQALIFNRFTQIEQGGLRSNKGGVGLGLAISKRLVMAMGGQITIDSKVERGSTFITELSLPCTDKGPLTDKDVHGIVTVDQLLSPLRLLVVDDIYLNFEVIKNYLKDFPVTISYAENGRKAQKAFLDDSCDIILMDLRMPVMGGIEAVAHIRRLENNLGIAPTPIIAMTAHAFVEQEKKYLESGFDEVLIKPFSKRDLLAILQDHSGQASAITEQTGDSEDQQVSVDDKSRALASLLPQVLDSIAKEIMVIKKTLNENDHEALEMTSHAVKGLAGFYGLPRLADLLELLERSASKREYRTARALVVAIGSHVDELRRHHEGPVEDIAN
ncbi:MAG: ATP-binding protein [Desulfocapsaceae bacterium]